MIFAREPFAVRAFATYPEPATTATTETVSADIDAILAATRNSTASLDAILGNLIPSQTSGERLIMVSGTERFVQVSAEERIVAISGGQIVVQVR